MNKSIFLWSSFTLIMVITCLNCYNLILTRNIDKLRLEVIVEPLVAYVEPIGETVKARITCYKETGNNMANGQYPKNGFVATSDRTIPFGTEIIIDGQTYIVGDRTALWVHTEKGFTIDVYMEEGCDLSYGAKIKDIKIK